MMCTCHLYQWVLSLMVVFTLVAALGISISWRGAGPSNINVRKVMVGVAITFAGVLLLMTTLVVAWAFTFRT